MKQSTINIIILLSLIVSVISLVLNLTHNDKNVQGVSSYIDEELMKNNISYVEDTNCQSDDLLFSAYCLRMKLMTFYNYTKNNTKMVMNLTDMKRLGGVCSHYSVWYEQNMKELGFYAQNFIMSTKNYTHEITITWDEKFDHVCILEQGRVACT